MPPLDLPKVAVTDLSEFMLTVQVVAVPEQAPLQPVNVERLPAVAVRVMAGVWASG